MRGAPVRSTSFWRRATGLLLRGMRCRRMLVAMASCGPKCPLTSGLRDQLGSLPLGRPCDPWPMG
eukprot:476044-Alexandrium_andersonii.AAC.1